MRIKKARKISGLGIALRDASIKDAEFILSLRMDPRLNRYISKVNGELAQQEAFLESYSRNDDEAFFVIEDEDGCSLGTIRMYDQRDDSFCWGSWIVHPDAPRKTGTRSALLLYYYAFDHLGFKRTHFDVRQLNEAVWKFHEECGAVLSRETKLDRFYILAKSTWNEKIVRYSNILQDQKIVVEEY